MTDPDLRRTGGTPEPRRTRILRLIGSIGFLVGLLLAVVLTSWGVAFVALAIFVVTALLDGLLDIIEEGRARE